MALEIQRQKLNNACPLGAFTLTSLSPNFQLCKMGIIPGTFAKTLGGSNEIIYVSQFVHLRALILILLKQRTWALNTRARIMTGYGTIFLEAFLKTFNFRLRTNTGSKRQKRGKGWAMGVKWLALRHF